MTMNLAMFSTVFAAGDILGGLKDYEDKEAAEVALIENLQREDLNPIEEAKGYKSLIDGFSMTQEEISKRVGKSRSAITNSLRILYGGFPPYNI